MNVMIPSPLLSYTGKVWVEASGATLAAVLVDLDRRYPASVSHVDEQDRMRRHIRFFVNGEQVSISPGRSHRTRSLSSFRPSAAAESCASPRLAGPNPEFRIPKRCASDCAARGCRPCAFLISPGSAGSVKM